MGASYPHVSSTGRRNEPAGALRGADLTIVAMEQVAVAERRGAQGTACLRLIQEGAQRDGDVARVRP